MANLPMGDCVTQVSTMRDQKSIRALFEPKIPYINRARNGRFTNGKSGDSSVYHG